MNAANRVDGPWSIPSNWQWVRIGDVAEVTGGGTPDTKRPEYWNGGAIPWITPADLSSYTNKTIGHGARNITEQGLAHSGAQILPAGTVLLSSRAPVGYVAIAANPLSTSQGFKSFTLRDGLFPDYIYWFLKGHGDLVRKYASGTTFSEISGRRAAEIPVPVAPIAEQRRIVAALEEHLSDLDVAIETLARTRGNCVRYGESVLRAGASGALIPGAGGPTDRWSRVILQDLIEDGRKCAYGVLQPGADRRSGIPLVRVGDISDGRVSIAGMKRVAPEIAARYPRTTLRGGELLVTIVGTIGRTAVAPPELAGANTARAVAVVPIGHRARADWLNIWFRSPDVRAQLIGRAHEVARKTLNLEDLRAVSVVLPPLEFQDKLVGEVARRLAVMERTIADIDIQIARALRLRQSTLKGAFEGRLVAHRAGDEPAAALLARAGASCHVTRVSRPSRKRKPNVDGRGT